jgi:hypothetical protein
MQAWLEKQGFSYVLAAPSQYWIFYEGARQGDSEVLARLPEKAVRARREQLYNWAAARLGEVDGAGSCFGAA